MNDGNPSRAKPPTPAVGAAAQPGGKKTPPYGIPLPAPQSPPAVPDDGDLPPELTEFRVHEYEPGHRERLIRAQLHRFEPDRIKDTVPPKLRLAEIEARLAAEAKSAENKTSEPPQSPKPKLNTERIVPLAPAAIDPAAPTPPDTLAAKFQSNPPAPKDESPPQSQQNTLMGVAPPARGSIAPPAAPAQQPAPEQERKVKLHMSGRPPSAAEAAAVEDGHAHQWERIDSDTGSIIDYRLADAPRTPLLQQHEREHVTGEEEDEGAEKQTNRKPIVYGVLAIGALILFAVLAKWVFGSGEDASTQASTAKGTPKTSTVEAVESPEPSAPEPEQRPAPSAVIAPSSVPVPDSKKPVVPRDEPPQAHRPSATAVSVPPATTPQPIPSQKPTKRTTSVFSESDLRPPLD